MTGTTSGTPFDGDYTAVLTADDGSLPEPGEEEPATATVTVVGLHGQDPGADRHRDRRGASGPTRRYRATHVFVGRYTAESTVRRADGTDGWYSVGLSDVGTGYAEAFDS